MKGMIAAGALLVMTPAAYAQDMLQKASAYVQNNVVEWAQSDIVIDAIRAQNARHAGIDAASIDALDQTWRSEIAGGARPTVSAMLEHPASVFLQTQVASMGGAVTEVILMDAVGLNVAVSAVTSDMWQGDEAKFQQTYPNGPNGLHVGEVEFDESTGFYQSQVSFTVVDPETGQPIGAMTIALNAENLL